MGSEALDVRLLPGFVRHRVPVPGVAPARPDASAPEDASVLALVGGEGPPVLLLHGDPQTHLCWHAVAPRLAERRTVVLTDLRGRGESHKPGPSADSAAYAKRASADEQLGVMRALGFERFAVVGHDRGARVATRMALDHPDRVERLAVLDIVPALDLYAATDADIARDYFWFFLLTQPHPYPERLIAGAPDAYLGHLLTGLAGEGAAFEPEVLAHYLEVGRDPAAIVAMCECFRAGLSHDVPDDRADRLAGRTVACPTLVAWGERSVVGRRFDVRAIWGPRAPGARFAPVPGGHFLPEEAPDEVARALLDFLG